MSMDLEVPGSSTGREEGVGHPPGRGGERPRELASGCCCCCWDWATGPAKGSTLGCAVAPETKGGLLKSKEKRLAAVALAEEGGKLVVDEAGVEGAAPTPAIASFCF